MSNVYEIEKQATKSTLLKRLDEMRLELEGIAKMIKAEDERLADQIIAAYGGNQNERAAIRYAVHETLKHIRGD